MCTKSQNADRNLADFRSRLLTVLAKSNQFTARQISDYLRLPLDFVSGFWLEAAEKRKPKPVKLSGQKWGHEVIQFLKENSEIDAGQLALIMVAKFGWSYTERMVTTKRREMQKAAAA